MALENLEGIANVSFGAATTELNGFMLDDWEDGVFTSRDDFTTRGYEETEPGSSATTVSDRPEYGNVSGLVINGSGEVEVDASADGHFPYPGGSLASLDNLTWEIRYRWAGNPNTSGDNVSLTRNSTSFTRGFEGGYHSGYVNNFFQNGDRLLSEMDSGGSLNRLIETAVGNDTNLHTLKTTRDGSGNWELLHDGSSLGTASDTSHTTSDGGGFVGDSPTLTQYPWFKWY